MRAAHGSNELKKVRSASLIRQFFSNFNDPIIKILLGAVAFNIVFTFGHTDWIECGGIAMAIILSTVVSTVSEHSSAKAFEKLAESYSGTIVTIRRGGTESEISAAEIVYGDVVLLKSGDVIPADGIIVGGSLSADQSALTGESDGKDKFSMTYLDEVTVSEQYKGDMNDTRSLFKGSSVLSGEGEMLVLAVGENTFYGEVASGLQEESSPSPLKKRLSDLAKGISFWGYIAAVMIAFAYLFNVFFIGNGLNFSAAVADIKNVRLLASEIINALTLAVSIVVVAVPEGLPMMITVVLSSNMKRMMRGGVLVRRMVGIETAGNLNVLFTDKTGTLTTGKLSVISVVTPRDSFSSVREVRNAPPIASMLAMDGAFCKGNGRGNATDRAMGVFSTTGSSRQRPVAKLPFESKNRMSAACIDTDDGLITIVRGAPETILGKCISYLDHDGGETSISSFARADLISEWNKRTSECCRVIVSAYCRGNRISQIEHGDMPELILTGMIVLRDEIRREVRKAVGDAHKAGIQVVMITGDNENTAESIARECGILTSKKDIVITGAGLSSMSDEEVKNIFPKLRVIARAVPKDKQRMVKLAKEMGLVVGMTGDGINDAPALKSADVGFAMGSGTDVAKEAGDIVITDDSFSSITRAVLYGRTIFISIRKFIVFQLLMNLCAVGVSLIGPFVGIENPVTIVQMLWVNIIMDTLGGLAFAGEAPLEEYMRRKPVSKSEGILSRKMVNQILFTGLYSLALCMTFLKSGAMRRIFEPCSDKYYLTVFFALFIFCGVFNSFNVRTERINLGAHLGKNKAFIIIMTAVMITQLTLIYFGGDVFRCVPLSAHDLLFAALLSLTVIPADIIRKVIFSKSRRQL